MNLFQQGKVTLHSGENALWKIECDALTNKDIQTIALMLMEVLPPFDKVEGVPRGGLRLAEALRGYSINGGQLLIVDDVTTTGFSLEKQRTGRSAIGAVIFARGRCQDWVTPLFQMPIKMETL